MNRGLARLYRSGEIRRVYDRWLGAARPAERAALGDLLHPEPGGVIVTKTGRWLAAAIVCIAAEAAAQRSSRSTCA